MPGVTQRMLTRQLRELEADQIVARKVYPEVPPKVEYTLTEFGQTLAPVLKVVQQWGVEYIERITAIRRKTPTETVASPLAMNGLVCLASKRFTATLCSSQEEWPYFIYPSGQKTELSSSLTSVICRTLFCFEYVFAGHAWKHVCLRPLGKRQQHRLKDFTKRRDRVFHLGWNFRIHLARNQPVTLKFTQLVRQHPLGQGGQ